MSSKIRISSKYLLVDSFEMTRGKYFLFLGELYTFKRLFCCDNEFVFNAMTESLYIHFSDLLKKNIIIGHPLCLSVKTLFFVV